MGGYLPASPPGGSLAGDPGAVSPEPVADLPKLLPTTVRSSAPLARHAPFRPYPLPPSHPGGDRTVVSMSEGRARSGGAVIEKLARERLGFERLRPGQLRAAEALASGRDVLAVLPTGGGKSAIYELAGMVLAGPTVVVSPLIALQDDQLAHLQAAGLPGLRVRQLLGG